MIDVDEKDQTTRTTDIVNGSTISNTENGDLHRCDSCDLELVEVDREWIGPGRWQILRACPGCDSEKTTETQGILNLGFFDPDVHAEKISDAYVRGDMSDEALERSLNRVFGLDE